jgi:hypothetical protein
MNFIPRVLVLLFASAPLWAQPSISITAPSARATISGTSFTGTVSISSAPSACIVQYLIDGESIGYARTQPYSLTFNPFDIGNGTEHHIQAVLMDCLQNPLAVSPSLPFTILNTNAVNSQMTVSCTTSDTSSWSGMVNCAASQSGSPASLVYGCFIDGIPTGNDNAMTTCAFPTFAFRNGTHKVLISASATNAAGQTMLFAVWEQPITFANASAHSQLRVNSREAYISTTGRYQLAPPIIVNADSSTASVTTVSYYVAPPPSSRAGPVSNTACSVNSSGLLTGLAFGLCDHWILSTNPAISSGAIPSPGITKTTGTIFLGVACPMPAHPPFPFILLLDRGSNTEAVLVTQGDCAGRPYAYFAVNRGYLGTTARTHAAGVPWVVPFQRQEFAYVESNNAILNWTSAGKIVSNWASNSIWLQSNFTGGTNNYWGPSVEPAIPPSVMSPAVATAFNAMEDSLFPAGCTLGLAGNACDNQADYESAMNTYWGTTLPGYLHAGGAHLYEHPSLTPVLIGIGGFFNYVLSPGGSWLPSAVTYGVQAAQNSRLVIGGWGPDEVDTQYGSTPFPSSVISAGGPFTRIVGNGTTAQVYTSAQIGVPTNYNNTFAIFGATTNSSLNCSPSRPGCPTSGSAGTFYTATSNSNGFTFPSTFKGTANSSTDPNLRIEPWVRNCTGVVWTCATNWMNVAPYYVPHTAWSTLKDQLAAVRPPLPISQPPYEGGLPWNAKAWMGSGSLSSFARIYNGCVPLNLTPLRESAYSVSQCIAGGTNESTSGIRPTFAALLGPKLLMPLMGAFTNVYYLGSGLAPGTCPGPGSVCITSITNETVTFAESPGIYNILPGVTRMIISGNSNNYYNTYWIIDSCPTATKCTISRRFPNTPAGNYPSSGSSAATLTFADNSTATLYSINADTSSQAGNTFLFASTPTCAVVHERGNIFTLSGGSGLPSYFTRGGQRFKLAVESNHGCPGVAQVSSYIWREVPTGESGTGGLAAIIPDNNFHNGLTSANSSNPVIEGPRATFSSIIEAAAVGAAAVSVWPPGSNPANYTEAGTPNGSVACNTANPPFTNADCSSGRFTGGHPFWEDGTGELISWQALASAFTILSGPHVTKCLFQPRAAAPDLGLGIETTVREGANSNCLMAVNAMDADVSVTVNLSSYRTGKSIMQLIGSWQNTEFAVLASDVTTHTVTIPAGGVAFWIAPAGPDAFTELLMSIPLGDIRNAQTIAVEYSCSTYPFTQQNQQLPLVTSTSTGSLSLPVDKNTCGTVTYRIHYLDRSGAPLATSSLETQ